MTSQALRTFARHYKVATVLLAIGAIAFLLDLGRGGPLTTFVGPLFWLGAATLAVNALMRGSAQFKARTARENRHVTVADTLLVASILVWAILISSIVINIFFVPTFAKVGHLKFGCYLTDALWYYVECRGFAFSAATSHFLSLPYALWLGPLLLWWSPLIGIPLWFFLLFPTWYVWHTRRHV